MAANSRCQRKLDLFNKTPTKDSTEQLRLAGSNPVFFVMGEKTAIAIIIHFITLQHQATPIFTN